MSNLSSQYDKQHANKENESGIEIPQKTSNKIIMQILTVFNNIMIIQLHTVPKPGIIIVRLGWINKKDFYYCPNSDRL